MKHKKRKIWPFAVMTLLFFGGVASILYPFVGNLVNVLTANTTINGYKDEVKNMPSDEKATLLARAQKYNENLYNGVPDSDGAKCLNRTDNIICYLDIPSINVYLPVYDSTQEDVLQKGCGHLENTSLPVGGKNSHSVIAGHTGLPNAEMLTNLDRLVEGDMFYIHVLDQILAYKVDNIESVTPDNADSLKITPGEDYVTLLTCTPYGINDRRLLVRGTRVPYTPEGDNSEITDLPSTEQQVDRAVISRFIIIAAISAAAIIIFIIAAVILHRDRKRHETSRQTTPEPPDLPDEKREDSHE